MQPKEQVGITSGQEESGEWANITHSFCVIKEEKEARHFMFLGEWFLFSSRGNIQ